MTFCAVSFRQADAWGVCREGGDVLMWHNECSQEEASLQKHQGMRCIPANLNARSCVFSAKFVLKFQIWILWVERGGAMRILIAYAFPGQAEVQTLQKLVEQFQLARLQCGVLRCSSCM